MKTIKNSKTAGISLVALVVTIIVLIILTGAVIVTFMDGGIIDRANESVFKNDIRSYQEKLVILKAKDQIAISTNQKDYEPIVMKENALTEAEIKTAIPEFNYAKYGALLQVVNGELVAAKPLSEDVKEEKWLIELGFGENDNKEITWDEAASKVGTAANMLKVGDYITYDSGVAGTTTLWKVLYNDSTRGVQIMPSTVQEKWNDIEYNDYIDIINEKTQKYINSKYAKAARSFGTNPISPEDNREYLTNNWDSTMKSEWVNENGIDAEFKEAFSDFTDYNQNVSIDSLPENAQIHTCNFYFDLTDTHIHLFCYGWNEYSYDSGICWEYNYDWTGSSWFNEGGWIDTQYNYILPVVTIYSDLMVSCDGENGSTNPYIIK